VRSFYRQPIVVSPGNNVCSFSLCPPSCPGFSPVSASHGNAPLVWTPKHNFGGACFCFMLLSLLPNLVRGRASVSRGEFEFGGVLACSSALLCLFESFGF
jgi:hypothetical protein